MGIDPISLAAITTMAAEAGTTAAGATAAGAGAAGAGSGLLGGLLGTAGGTAATAGTAAALAPAAATAAPSLFGSALAAEGAGLASAFGPTASQAALLEMSAPMMGTEAIAGSMGAPFASGASVQPFAASGLNGLLGTSMTGEKMAKMAMLASKMNNKPQQSQPPPVAFRGGGMPTSKTQFYTDPRQSEEELRRKRLQLFMGMGAR
jgi:hypothetical protein